MTAPHETIGLGLGVGGKGVGVRDRGYGVRCEGLEVRDEELLMTATHDSRGFGYWVDRHSIECCYSVWLG